MTSPELQAAAGFVHAALQHRGNGKRERVLIDNLTSHLRGMFPDSPAWVDEHIHDAEEQVHYAESGHQRRAHIDNIVGYTSIEYEHDLRKKAVFDQGLKQVGQHLAGLLNRGAPQPKLVGVLSDTVTWRVYRIKSVNGAVPNLGPDDIELDQIDQLELSATDPQASERIHDFLQKYLAREGARVLTADTLVEDLGFQSALAQRGVAALDKIVQDAFTDRPAYAGIIKRLWWEFVGSVGGSGPGNFDDQVYVSELYLLTLAKLICANVIECRALHSDAAQVRQILDGSHFHAKGLANVGEYDYFGWLNADPYVSRILPLASEVQRALRRFDFESPAPEDLFGRLVAQLARRSQRLLLGQECTPPWLAQRMAKELDAGQPNGQQPRFLDMCCGSGPMIVEVVKLAKASLPQGIDPVDELRQVATGFDIDPLAVMLAKVNWVAAARDKLPLDGSREITVPIYHADSMFAKTPISAVAGHGGTSYELKLDTLKLQLPTFLVSPKHRALFDALLDVCHRVAMAGAAQAQGAGVSSHDIKAAVATAASISVATLTPSEEREVAGLADDLVRALEQLERSQLNGIWAFVLRNSYRPGLLAGQFNGLIANPPWLALSKIADNPYQQALDSAATGYGIKPSGSAHLHTELSTTYLLHAVDRYLVDKARIACVLPETVLNGHHHDSFRRGAFTASATPVKLNPTAIWRVQSGTFKNEAVVLLGEKSTFKQASTYPGALVSAQGDRPVGFKVIKLGVRTAWSDAAGSPASGLFTELAFRQGADLMPRTAVFHETASRAGNQYHLGPIDPSTSAQAYLVKGAKKLETFRVTPNTVQDRYVYHALLSAHLSPFELGDPVKALLPFTRDAKGAWSRATPVSLAPHAGSKAVFDQIIAALTADAGAPVSLADYQDKLDWRRKLTLQSFPDATKYLVVFPAGGSKTTAAYGSLSRFDCSRLVIDQTLYFTVVDSEDAALYLSGLLNSAALDRAIKKFQPRGAFGERHIHSLPVSVTPAYDATQRAHLDVVKATKDLMTEIAGARSIPWPAKWFDPNSPLHVRRPRVFQAITALDAYEDYDHACSALYGV